MARAESRARSMILREKSECASPTLSDAERTQLYL
jgi:hypothetical protein